MTVAMLLKNTLRSEADFIRRRAPLAVTENRQAPVDISPVAVVSAPR